MGAGGVWWLISFVTEVNSLKFTSYDTPIPVWAQGLFSLGVLTCGVFMMLIGLIRAGIINIPIQRER
jgi:hypothetical protein